MRVYYNEFDKKKAAALKELMADGLIRAGDIDDRPIQEVNPDDLKGYKRCHFFAGIGLWDYALDLAGYTGPVWTGSCPCQPFSSAGLQKGKADDRHLWPYWERLITQCRPATIFGEQVSSSIAHGWLDDVYQGLEAQGYAIGSAVLPACGVGAPHKRDRLWFVANRESTERAGKRTKQDRQQNRFADRGSTLGYANGQGSQGRPIHAERAGELSPWSSGVGWIGCPDGKKRLVKSEIRLLADGYPNRVLQLHCAGDAIVPQVAAKFIEAYMMA